jgi:hypothetical protein
MEAQSSNHFNVVWFNFDNGYTASISQMKSDVAKESNMDWNPFFHFAAWKTGADPMDFVMDENWKSHKDIAGFLEHVENLEKAK